MPAMCNARNITSTEKIDQGILRTQPGTWLKTSNNTPSMMSTISYIQPSLGVFVYSTLGVNNLLSVHMFNLLSGHRYCLQYGAYPSARDSCGRMWRSQNGYRKCIAMHVWRADAHFERFSHFSCPPGMDIPCHLMSHELG